LSIHKLDARGGRGHVTQHNLKTRADGFIKRIPPGKNIASDKPGIGWKGKGYGMYVYADNQALLPHDSRREKEPGSGATTEIEHPVTAFKNVKSLLDLFQLVD
jgi:hypothetical protein